MKTLVVINAIEPFSLKNVMLALTFGFLGTASVAPTVLAALIFAIKITSSLMNLTQKKITLTKSKNSI